MLEYGQASRSRDGSKKRVVFAAVMDERDIFALTGSSIDGRFSVGSVLGEGGFAVVYEGHHVGLDAKVAIKCLKIPTKLDENERKQFLDSFIAEGRLLHKLARSDRGIVDALDVGATTSPNGKWVPYIVLEWLDGRSLEEDFTERRRKGIPGRSLGETIRLLDSAARGLATAHRQGVAHRDVKPANVFMIRGDGEVRTKVLDFGIAKVKADSPDVMRAFEMTGTSLQAFTPRYGAPEQFDRNHGATGPWTDVFALALIVVECVAGKSAMDGDPSQLYVTASNRARRPTLRTMQCDEGDAVEAILQRALAVDVNQRTSDVGTFWNELTTAVMTGDTEFSRAMPGKAPTFDLGQATRREGFKSDAPGASDMASLAASSVQGPATAASPHASDLRGATLPSLAPPTVAATPSPSLLVNNSAAETRRAEVGESAVGDDANALLTNSKRARSGDTKRSAGTPASLANAPSAAYGSKEKTQTNMGLVVLGLFLLAGAGYWKFGRSNYEAEKRSARPTDSTRVVPPTLPTFVPTPSAKAPSAFERPANAGFFAHRTPLFEVELPEGFTSRGDGFAFEDATAQVDVGVAEKTTLSELLAAAKTSSDGGSRFVTHEEATTTSYLLAGLDGEKAFVDRVIVGEGRYARLRLDYGPLAKDRIESKLEHTLATFALVARSNGH